MESRAKAFIFNFKRGIAAVTLDSHKKQSTCLPSSDDHFRSELSSFDDNFRAENGLELESVANTEIMNNPICSRDLEKEILELQGRRSGCSYDVKAEPSHKLPLQEQFF